MNEQITESLANAGEAVGEQIHNMDQRLNQLNAGVDRNFDIATQIVSRLDRIINLLEVK